MKQNISPSTNSNSISVQSTLSKHKNATGIISGSNHCHTCNQSKSAMELVPSHSPFWPTGRTTLCYSCVECTLDGNNLNHIDRLCQFANIAFLPEEWRKMWKQHSNKAFRRYCESYYSINYYKYDWSEQNEALKAKASKGTIATELDELRPELLAKLKQEWGDLPERDLLFLEELFNTSLSDYAIYTAQEKEMLKKICRLSLLIDHDFDNSVVDKDKIAQYDKLLTSLQKVVDKNESEGINTAGKIVEFIERNGYVANFYDNLSRDEYDRLISNIHEHNKDLVLSAVNITEKFEARKKQLETRKMSKEERARELEKLDNDQSNLFDDDDMDGDMYEQ